MLNGRRNAYHDPIVTCSVPILFVVNPAPETTRQERIGSAGHFASSMNIPTSAWKTETDESIHTHELSEMKQIQGRKGIPRMHRDPSLKLLQLHQNPNGSGAVSKKMIADL
jgi:hypothetical protein